MAYRERQLVIEIIQARFPQPERIVEGGIGSCRNLLELQKLGHEVHGFDVLPEAVARGHRLGLTELQVHDLGVPWPLADQSTGVVVLLDVLEHLANPVQVLRNAKRVLKPSGAVVLTVPAYPWLYGDWDKRLGHFRRYTADELREHAEAAGFRVDWLTHWNAFTLPAAVAVRGYQRCFPRDRSTEFPRVHRVVNRMLLSMSRWERWWMKRGKVPFGLSLVGVLVP